MIQSNAAQRQPRRWFITGATGFIRREFISHLLAQNIQTDTISVLVRSGTTVSAAERFESAVEDILTPSQLQRINVVPGNVVDNRFGLTEDQWNSLVSTTHLVHLAANTSFTATLERARQCNVEGVRNVIDLATACQSAGHLEHWSHVSTAYIAGKRTDKVCPGDLESGGGFRNSYEQSKNEAEQLLQPMLDKFPLTIFRPSIVVGHSATGKAGNFNTVYWGIRSYLSGQTKVYGLPDAPIDIIPVDFVVKAMYQLIEDQRTTGKTMHLAGGQRTSVSLFDFIDSVCRYLDSPPPEIVNPSKLRRMRGIIALAKLSARNKRFIEQAESYLPYFSQNPQFDTSETERFLCGTDIQVPRLDAYIDKILDYCLAQNWGKRARIVGAGYRQLATVNG